MHYNLLLAWLTAFFSTTLFKKAANQANSKLWCINYTSYVLKNSVLTKLALYAGVLHSFAGISFFLASQWFHTFKSFSNLHFLGLAFFYIRDVFGIGYVVEHNKTTKWHSVYGKWHYGVAKL